MVAHWKHIDESQRVTISRMLSNGNRLKEIAKALGMHPTALSREIRRNRSKTKPGEGGCPKTKRFPFVCNACPRRYERSCRFAHYRYDPTAAQALADSRLRVVNVNRNFTNLGGRIFTNIPPDHSPFFFSSLTPRGSAAAARSFVL